MASVRIAVGCGGSSRRRQLRGICRAPRPRRLRRQRKAATAASPERTALHPVRRAPGFPGRSCCGASFRSMPSLVPSARRAPCGGRASSPFPWRSWRFSPTPTSLPRFCAICDSQPRRLPSLRPSRQPRPSGSTSRKKISPPSRMATTPGSPTPQRGHGGREGKAVPRRLGHSGISGAEPAVAGHKSPKMLLAIGSMDASVVHGASMGALRCPGGVQLSYRLAPVTDHERTGTDVEITPKLSQTGVRSLGVGPEVPGGGR